MLQKYFFSTVILSCLKECEKLLYIFLISLAQKSPYQKWHKCLNLFWQNKASITILKQYLQLANILALKEILGNLQMHLVTIVLNIIKCIADDNYMPVILVKLFWLVWSSQNKLNCLNKLPTMYHKFPPINFSGLILRKPVACCPLPISVLLTGHLNKI